MKKLFLFLVSFSITTMAMSQIKVVTNGNVGLGTNSPYSNCKLTIMQGANDIIFSPDNNGNNRIMIGGYSPSQNTPEIEFYHPRFGFNKVKFRSSSLSSDSILKTNIIPLERATPILKQIKTYSYYFKSDVEGLKQDSIDSRKKDYGILAQEIEEILPELVDTCFNTRFVNYNAFIAILIKGFNEQQGLIETQQSEIETLQNIVSSQEAHLIKLQKTTAHLQEWMYVCCGDPKGAMQIPDNTETPKLYQENAILYQNVPNPFSANTEITCHIPKIDRQAVIMIYNLQGAELKSYTLTQTGFNSIVVSGSELPAGMYLYTLVVDNEIIDTKRMILTK